MGSDQASANRGGILGIIIIDSFSGVLSTALGTFLCRNAFGQFSELVLGRLYMITSWVRLGQIRYLPATPLLAISDRRCRIR